MKRKTNLPEDPVVSEVRAARAKLWEEAGGTMEGLTRLVKKRADNMRKRRRPRRDPSN